MSRWWTLRSLLLVSVVGVVAVPQQPVAATALPTITVGDAQVWEGDAGSAVVRVPVDLSAPSATKVTVHYAITGTSASAGSDFVAGSGKLTFPANIATKSVSVLVYGDGVLEQDENIAITLSAPVGATLAKDTGSVTILDDDANGVGSGIEVNVGSVTVVEADAGKHVATVAITLSRPAPSTIKVAYVADCATALPGTDYSGNYKGTVTFLKDQQSKNLTFNIVADFTPEDLVKQFLESVTVKLGPSVVVNQVEGGGAIIDNDGSSGSGAVPLALHEIKRVSVASDGTEAGAADSFCGAGPFAWGALDETVSGNGRYVAFDSDAMNLVAGDNNRDIDAFVHDLVTGETERISVQNDGSEFSSNYSVNPWQTAYDEPSLSYDGRYATFTDIAEGKIYLRDRVAQTTELISVAPDGSRPNQWGATPDVSSVSADGRYVAFTSRSTNLVVPAPPANVEHIYVRDRATQTTRLVVSLGLAGGGWSLFGGVKISADGRYVAFQNSDSTLVPGDNNGCADTFVYDMVTDSFERVSVDSNGNQQTQCGNTNVEPVISSDGRYVGFTSPSPSLYGATPSQTVAWHAYVHDRVTGTTTLIDDPSVNPIDDNAYVSGVSDDGRYATWSCQNCGDPLPAAPSVSGTAAFWTDLQTGQTDQIGMTAGGDPPIILDTGQNPSTRALGMSADGSIVAFDTWATNLIPDDTNGKLDVYAERMR